VAFEAQDLRTLAAPLVALTRLRHLHMLDYGAGADVGGADLSAALDGLALLTHLTFAVDVWAAGPGSGRTQHDLLPLPAISPTLAHLDLGNAGLPVAAMSALSKTLSSFTALKELALPSQIELDIAISPESTSSTDNCQRIKARVRRASEAQQHRTIARPAQPAHQ
jgi:hypothetical protein